jgi:hypothetical protein
MSKDRGFQEISVNPTIAQLRQELARARRRIALLEAHLSEAVQFIWVNPAATDGGYLESGCDDIALAKQEAAIAVLEENTVGV